MSHIRITLDTSSDAIQTQPGEVNRLLGLVGHTYWYFDCDPHIHDRYIRLYDSNGVECGYAEWSPEPPPSA